VAVSSGQSAVIGGSEQTAVSNAQRAMRSEQCAESSGQSAVIDGSDQ
jgi:hypothetical protein